MTRCLMVIVAFLSVILAVIIAFLVGVKNRITGNED